MKKGFIIDSLPRTGSTSLVRLLNCHPDIHCLVEPFHPRRYNGEFHRMALRSNSVAPVLDLIWQRWNGIKHVSVGTTGFPFSQTPELNDEILLETNRVIVLERRNLLRRYISEQVCRRLGFWIGTRQEFLARLGATRPEKINPAVALEEIEKDKAAMAKRVRFLVDHRVPMMRIAYEDLFGEQIARSHQYEILTGLVGFLGFRDIPVEEFSSSWSSYLDTRTYQWCSRDIYLTIPGIKELDQAIGSEDIGRLF
jgi:hypothetical protein